MVVVTGMHPVDGHRTSLRTLTPMARTLSDAQVVDVARRHETARVTRTSIRRSTLDHPEMTLDDAYACQKAWVDRQIADGASVIGHKIGLTSRAMQLAMKIDEPDFGTLLDYMAIANHASFRADDFLDPKLEVELAFVLSHDLDGSVVTTHTVLDATAYVTPALELIDARSFRVDPVDKVARNVCDTISDNAADAGIVTGDLRVAPRERDLRWVGAIAKRNGSVEETGVAAGVLDDPVQGIVWLARRLHGLGITLRAGEIILCGSFTRPIDCRRGDHFDVDFGDLGRITVDVE